MTFESAEKLIRRLAGQPVHDYCGGHERYRPADCSGPAGKVICLGEPMGSDNRPDEVACEVVGWNTTIGRSVEDIVLPRGLTLASVIEAMKVLAGENE